MDGKIEIGKLLARVKDFSPMLKMLGLDLDLSGLKVQEISAGSDDAIADALDQLDDLLVAGAEGAVVELPIGKGRVAHVLVAVSAAPLEGLIAKAQALLATSDALKKEHAAGAPSA